NQIMITRALSTPDDAGVIHWSIGPLVKYPKVANGLLEGPYQKQALDPASPWLGNDHVQAPKVDYQIQDDNATIQITPSNHVVYRWILYFQYGDVWSYKIVGTEELTQLISKVDKNAKKLIRVEIAAIDRFGNEGKRTILTIP